MTKLYEGIKAGLVEAIEYSKGKDTGAYELVLDKNYKPTKKEERQLTRRNKITSMEHYIEKLESSARATMGFCVKVMDNNPFKTDFHLLQNDASYLHRDIETLLEEKAEFDEGNENG